MKECKITECQNKLQQLKFEGIKKRGRPRTRWTDKCDGDLNMQ
jgi:hypothetical protein